MQRKSNNSINKRITLGYTVRSLRWIGPGLHINCTRKCLHIPHNSVPLPNTDKVCNLITNL